MFPNTLMWKVWLVLFLVAIAARICIFQEDVQPENAIEEPLEQSDNSEHLSDDLECYETDEASWALRRWVLTELLDDDQLEKHKFAFYDTDLTLVKEEDGPAWYIAGGGWEGMFYYEGGDAGEERAGAYLYPDYLTAVVGVWKDHMLVSGRNTELGMACRTGRTWTLWFGDLEGPVLKYSPPSHYSLGVSPLQSDPYERKLTEVRHSSFLGAEDGLFAIRPILSGEVVAFYSGFIIHCDSALRALSRREFSDEEEHVRNMYNIALDTKDSENLCIDIPPELGTVSKYNATLGHKVNHSFAPNCEFVLFSVHPVLGTIMALAALQDMETGTELSVNYGYNYTTEKEQPQWFIKQWQQFYNHQEL